MFQATIIYCQKKQGKLQTQQQRKATNSPRAPERCCLHCRGSTTPSVHWTMLWPDVDVLVDILPQRL